MKALKTEEICEGVSGKVLKHGNDIAVRRVEIDSRKVCKDDVFFAIIGENHDAHRFIPACLEAGCRTFVISDESCMHCFDDYEDANVVLTDDTSLGLQRLAAYYLDSLNIRRIGVTGSTGKTSTKDMIVCVCSSKFKTAGTKGNFNNLIGMPRTALSLDEDTEVGVFEMGMDRFGEISALSKIVKPDIGVITNIGVSHIENLGSREGIFKAKMEITEGFGKENTLIVWRDDEFLNDSSISGDFKTVISGTDERSSFIVSDITDRGIDGVDFAIRHENEKYSAHLSVPGTHNAWNASLAVACGYELGISIPDAIHALEDLNMTEKRLTVKTNGIIRVIDDTYNASPDSMRAGLSVLMNTEGKRKVAVLGDMFELGEKSAEYHRQVGEFAGKCGCDLLVTIGEMAENIHIGASPYMNEENMLHFSSKEKFFGYSGDLIEEGDVVIVKASRGMALEDVVNELLRKQG